MEDVKFPDLWIETGDDGKISVVMVDAIGWAQRLPPVIPVEDLISASELDYTAYRREIQRLYDEHPLFEARLDIAVSDLEDFAAEALILPAMLQETDPLSFFEVGCLLDQALRMRDDGSASFLLYAGQRLLQALEVPIRTQIRLRNIMEMTFDGMERATQQERFEKLRSVYPEVAAFCDPARLGEYDGFLCGFALALCFSCAWRSFCCTSGKKNNVLPVASTAGITLSQKPKRRPTIVTAFLTGRVVKNAGLTSSAKRDRNRMTP